jgi:hypothetical protein
MINEDSKTKIGLEISFDDDIDADDVTDSIKDIVSSKDVKSNAASKEVNLSKKQKSKKTNSYFSFCKKVSAKLRKLFKKFALKSNITLVFFSWLKFKLKKVNNSKSKKNKF